METEPDRLSQKARIVLNYIAEGHSYEQILRLHPNLNFKDIFAAAQEALDIIEADTMQTSVSEEDWRLDYVSKIRERYPHAYEPWMKKDDALLTKMFVGGAPIQAIASALKRKSSAIRSRIKKIGLGANNP